MQVRSTHIVVVGLPGSGKSAVGFAAARQLGHPFFDVNTMSETPSSHHLADGENHDAVADAERDWFASIVATSGPSIIAAPWSAVPAIIAERPDNIWIVLLDVSVEAAKQRLAADGADTSLHDRLEHLGAEHTTKLNDLRQIADVTIDTDGCSIDELVDRLRTAWRATGRCRDS